MNEDGVQKLIFLFLIASQKPFTTIAHTTPTPIAYKGYGIATPKGSIWRDKISLAILELQEKGTIQILYDKWWKNTGGKDTDEMVK